MKTGLIFSSALWLDKGHGKNWLGRASPTQMWSPRPLTCQKLIFLAWFLGAFSPFLGLDPPFSMKKIGDWRAVVLDSMNRNFNAAFHSNGNKNFRACLLLVLQILSLIDEPANFGLILTYEKPCLFFFLWNETRTSRKRETSTIGGHWGAPLGAPQWPHLEQEWRLNVL